tara:strand:- start:1777 stop:4062 length:2286 start_codon:yes stop_codon:yes gene_type:complete
MTDRRFTLVVWLLGISLAGLFWWPLVTGGGFVGGDIYSYYFPQKTFYAEQLQQGHSPFWNDRVGHGYPMLAESQAGVFYPPHLALYTWLEVNTAYSLSHLLHYVLAFVFTVGYAGRFGISRFGALLAGLVYVYGWFPTRSCWEWAIIGGTWLPAALWLVECVLQTRRWRFAGLLAGVLWIQMMAGHFQLAWITQLVLVVYVPCRLWWLPVGGPLLSPPVRWRAGVLLVISGGLAIGLAAIQLLPTWEFRRVSQRAEVGAEHPLQFGSIPAWYWTQAVMPFRWYSPTTDRTAALQADPPIPGVATNEGEAHLYFGLAPLLLAALGTGSVFRRGDPGGIFWILLGTLALFYTTGRMVPLVDWLPGFSYFQGPGRYGVVVTLAVALLAGEMAGRWLTPVVNGSFRSIVVWLGSLTALGSSWWLVDVTWVVVEASPGGLAAPDWLPSIVLMTAGLGVFAVLAAVGLFLVSRPRGAQVVAGQRLALAVLSLATVMDLWLVAHLVQFTEVLEDPPITRLASSPVRQALSESKMPPRVFAPMANFPTVLGVSATPVYFTFGPSEYTRRDLMMPSAQVEDPDDSFVPQTEAQMDWLERAGVTHIVSYKPIDPVRWPVEEIWRGRDPVMNSALGRGAPLFLYRLTEGRGRVSWDSGGEGNSIAGYSATGSEVMVDVTTRVAGRLVLTELMAEGWQVEVDGSPRKVELVEGMYRGVRLEPGESRVRWHYQPPGLYWGFLISSVALLVLATAGLIQYRKPGWLAGLELNEPS